MNSEGLIIRPAQPTDWNGIWEIFRRVVSKGDTYSYPPDTSESEAKRIWLSPPAVAYIAESNNMLVGTYVLRPNQPGLGSHVANAGYMVHPEAERRGIGRIMCEHSMNEARANGYLAMQFNFVVSTNTRAVKLWERLGFRIVGTIPGAFRHAGLGLVDAHIMYRTL
jgi:ribosomal protein S18 acetylase RimI-like enzyme